MIQATCDEVYRAFIDPTALAIWQAPEGMTAKIHAFDARVGGGYTMSLFYSADADGHPGKTAEREDRYTARFVELTPPSRIVEAITFDTDDPAFAGEMQMTVTLEEKGGGTEVTFLFENLPPGIRTEDNEAGTQSTLKNLARFVERNE